MKLTVSRRAVTTSIAAAFLVGGLATAAPASAAGSYSCGNWKMKVNTWSASCKVKSGQARAVTDCSNGKTIYGKWVGRGQWRFGGDCGKYFIVAHTTQGRG
ncbi:hypothetical protein ACFWZT_39045 [Streptomyces alboflavus]|uniref:Uncharacterized protein n=1 Tax=Streptomyces alboflavus TaxID=67267 RepID=A0A1Z1WKX3_9ACTN|nr:MULTISPECIES: hypothetical protein [Streptomyces]ARX87096.1 hypothetical protein SMD44_06577 [Streptomyces alboflavus]WJV45606.1 hypothetical protein QUY26_08705 [Streptomyces flavofungini]